MNAKDITGQKFGKLKALHRVDPEIAALHDSRKGAHWLCACDCGNHTIAYGYHLRAGTTTSCGCAKVEANRRNPRLDVTGMRFGILTALGYSHSSEGQGSVWRFRCDCGNETLARLKDVRHGNTASCGCKKLRTGFKINQPAFDINRPWRKQDAVDEHWLVLIGERCAPNPEPPPSSPYQSPRRRPVRCLQTGTVSPSFLEAAVWLRTTGHTKAAAGAIVNACRGKAHTAYGYEWSYAS